MQKQRKMWKSRNTLKMLEENGKSWKIVENWEICMYIKFQKRLFERHSVIQNRWKFIKKRAKTRRIDCRHSYLNLSSELKVINFENRCFPHTQVSLQPTRTRYQKMQISQIRKKNIFGTNFRFRREFQLKITEIDASSLCAFFGEISSILDYGMSRKNNFWNVRAVPANLVHVYSVYVYCTVSLYMYNYMLCVYENSKNGEKCKRNRETKVEKKCSNALHNEREMVNC